MPGNSFLIDNLRHKFPLENKEEPAHFCFCIFARKILQQIHYLKLFYGMYRFFYSTAMMIG